MGELSQKVTVNSLKFDGEIRRSWVCRLLADDNDCIVLEGIFESAVEHPQLGLIAEGTRSVEYFPRERWFNVFVFYNPSGPLRNFYCNVSLPFEYHGDRIDVVDLDLDILVWPEGAVELLDEADFVQNCELLHYPEEVKQGALNAVAELRRLIDAREWMFSSLPKNGETQNHR
jgi:protein associated with RNAse G/E